MPTKDEIVQTFQVEFARAEQRIATLERQLGDMQKSLDDATKVIAGLRVIKWLCLFLVPVVPLVGYGLIAMGKLDQRIESTAKLLEETRSRMTRVSEVFGQLSKVEGNVIQMNVQGTEARWTVSPDVVINDDPKMKLSDLRPGMFLLCRVAEFIDGGKEVTQIRVLEKKEEKKD